MIYPIHVRRTCARDQVRYPRTTVRQVMRTLYMSRQSSYNRLSNSHNHRFKILTSRVWTDKRPTVDHPFWYSTWSRISLQNSVHFLGLSAVKKRIIRYRFRGICGVANSRKNKSDLTAYDIRARRPLSYRSH